MNPDIASRVRQIRTDLNLTQEALGKFARVTKAAVSQWERGLSEPGRDALLALHKSKRINPDWIIGGTGAMFIDGRGVSEADSPRYTLDLELSLDERTLLEKYRRLSQHNKDAVQTVINALDATECNDGARRKG